MERLDCFITYGKWEIVDVKMPEVNPVPWEGKYFAATHQKSEGKIMILGGYTHQKLKDSVFCLDVISNEIIAEPQSLNCPDSFYQRDAVQASDGIVYVLGYETGGVHMFNGEKWLFVKQDVISFN